MSQARTVRCQNCGSPLQVTDAIRFVTCAYCNTGLEIVREASTIHTQILENLEARTVEMSGSLKTIELQNEIERLDREWQMWREANLPRGKSGQVMEPAPVAAAVSGVVAAVFIIGWIILSASITSNAPGPVGIIFPLFGVFVLVAVIYNMATQASAGSGYEEARQVYQTKRAALLGQLPGAEAKAPG